MVRRSSTENFQRIEHLRDRIELFQADLLDQTSIAGVLAEVQPDEVYNLAAQSFVPTSWNQPVLTAEFTAVGVTRMLDAIRQVCPKARFYQASSQRDVRQGAGDAADARRRRSTRAAPTAWPRSTATTSRSTTARATACSPARASSSTTSRRAAAWSSSRARSRIASPASSCGLANELRLGNLQAKRDWGFAGDYVRAMWLMLQQDEPDDYVVGTGETHTVQEFVRDRLRPRRPGLAQVRRASTRRSSGRPRSICCWATPPRRGGCSAGSRRSASSELVQMMVDADLQRLSGGKPS